MIAEPVVSNAQWTKFLQSISHCESISKACAKAKISRATAYRYYEKDKWVKQQWDQAIDAGREYLEDAGISRAIKGVKKEKGIYFEGRLIAVEVEHKYSDTIWLAAMAARDPRYRKDTLDSKVMVELHKALDRLQRGLTSEEYEKVLNILSSDDMIDVTATNSETAPRQLGTASDDP